MKKSRFAPRAQSTDAATSFQRTAAMRKINFLPCNLPTMAAYGLLPYLVYKG